MKESTYCPLHQHTFYSLGDSCCTPQEIAEVLSDHGITACAITEHGNMFSIQEAYLALKKKDIKLIPGIEVYVAEHGHSRFERPKKKSKKDKENDGTEYNESSDMNYNYCHLILLAKDYTGYKNLIQIASEGFNEESFYYKPRVDFEYIKEHKEGLVVLSACLAGNINRLIVEGKYEEAKQIAKDYKNVFGKENFFLECQYHGIPEENIMNDGLLKIAQELDLDVVITNDSHSAYKEDALPHGKHDVLVTSKYKQNIDDPNRTWVGAYGCGQHYIKSEEEMRQLPVVSKHPELIENTKKIADMCSFDYAVLFEKPTDNPSGMHIPIVDFDKAKFKDDKEYLRFRVYEGLNKIFNNNIPVNYKEQADYEIEVISDLGFASYMLTQQNFMKITEDAGVTHGVGRGCVSKNTLIHTSNGLVEISKLKIGDRVLGDDGNFHFVLDTMKYPTKSNETLVRPIIADGDRLDDSHFFTKNHKVLCVRASKLEESSFSLDNLNPEWVEISTLNPGDFLIKPRTNVIQEEYIKIKDSSDTQQNVLVYEDFVLKKVIGLEETMDIDYVYDITVQDVHNYVTNDYVAHNSAAGSIVSYALGITGIDPIKYNLIFERFLAPGGGRVSLPDIDVDFSDKAAAYKAIEDVYGKERVAHVLNITYLKARSSLQEVARILDFTPKESDEITKLIPEGAIDITLKEALDTVQDIKSRYNSDPKFKRLFDLAMKIEGLGYNTGVHASATIVADKPIAENYVQTMSAEKSKIRCIGLQGSECEKNFLIKFDLLGLSNLNFINSTKQQLLKTRPELPPIDFTKIEIKDHPFIFKSLYEDTLGIFQFESAGMGGTLKQMLFDINKLDSLSQEEQKVAAEEFFERMMAAVALYRPGPMDNIPQYISNMKNPSGTKYIEDVNGVNKEVLKSTYGVMVYQESLMEILRLMSGQDYSFSDRARRAIAKKHLEDLPKLKGTFIEGAIAQGNTKEIAEKVWKAIEDGSGYSFNKAHACAYAYIGWQTAYLKHYFEPEYFCSILSNSEGDDLKKYISACKNKLGIKIVHPDINLSETKFTTRVVDYSQPLTLADGRSNKDNFEIIFGLEGINGVSSKTALPIIQERTENGPFSSFEDFISRCESFISSDVLINLIRTGCFDNLDDNRFKLEYNAKKLLDNIKKKKKQDQTMAERIEKERLLAEEEGREPKEIKNRFKPLDLEMEFVDDLSIDDRAFREKASANMFFEYNPLSKFKKDLVSLPQNHTIQDIISNKNISRGTFIVVLSNVKKKVSKNSGKQFATCTISDLTGEAEGVIYETVLNAKENLLVETKCLCVKCNIKNDRGTPTLVVNDIFEADDPQLKQKVLEDAGFKKQVNRRESYDRYDIDKSEFEKGIHVQIENRQDLSEAVKFFEPFKGMSKVFFYIKDSKYNDSVYFGDVRANTEESGFERELIQRFGEENVKII